MKIFISAGEPSGDVHGANLVRELRRLDPSVECVGFGGDHMTEAGCKLLYPLCQLAVMWFLRVLTNVTTFLSLLSRADRYFRHQRPDAVILIDYPGFHWWLARRARFHGIPVFYFVPPQLWAWGGWRVKKMQRFVDHVLCSLPFEEPWYRERGVNALYVGHPFFDETPQQKLDEAFMKQMRGDGPIVGILPGSRTQEIERNLSTQMRAARKIHAARPDTRFLVACYRSAHQQMIDAYLKKHPPLPVRTFVGRTPEIIQMAHSCLTVSGSVSLELLYALKPSVVVYRIRKIDLAAARWFMTTRKICLVNLLDDRDLFPEFLSDRCVADAMAEEVVRWLENPARYSETVTGLKELRDRVAQPGACGRVARYVLDKLATDRRQAA